MYLLPAIDILGGKAVRLAKGDYAQVTTYNEDPVEQARIFQAAGAAWLHVVDLDGAKSGKPENIEVIKQILLETDLNVEVGGGIRSLETIDALVAAGVSRMVLGTALVRNPDLGREAVARYGADCFSAGIDAKGGEVAIAGWREGSGVAATELAKSVAELGFIHLVYTDIARDGMQCGIEPEAYARMAEAFGHPVIASGGVASTADIFALAPVADSIEGVITGRAIYEGTLDVVEGIAACRFASQGESLAELDAQIGF